MGPLPDLRWLFWFSLVGILVTFAVAAAGASFIIYHGVLAMLQYNGL